MNKLIKFFLLSLILSSAFFAGINYFQENLENFLYAQISKPFQEMVFVNLENRPKKPPLEIEAKSVLSLKINRFGREKIFWGQNTNQILPIASLTKLMTALILLKDPENYDFEKKLTISKEAAAQENVPEYGNLNWGEKKRVGELLDLMLTYSSNDASWALAEVIGVKDFVDRMNREAKNLGLNNTNFLNPTGLDPENLLWDEENKEYFNYSTSDDLMKLTKYILEEFPLIFELTIQKNKFSLLENQKIIGIKTGYTDEAGGCIFLIFSDEKENYFINIILGTKSKEARFEEMQKLIDWINQ